jgi:hypothetical protein
MPTNARRAPLAIAVNFKRGNRMPCGLTLLRRVARDRYVHDANSGVRRLVDDRGDVTDYEYDTLDRETVMCFHDGSTRVRVYNEASDVVRFTDENGSVFANTFDALGRKTDCTITKAAGVVGTDQQSFEYDGLTRQTQAIDTVGGTDATVQMFYDSMNRVVEDSQSYTGGTRNVTTTALASHPISQLQFPNGRKIDNTYDLLYRRTDVADNGGSTIATWQFFGPSRVAELTMGNGLICSHLNNARTRSSIQENQTEEAWQGQVTPVWGDQSSDRLGYDGASRMITKRYLAGGINPITFGYLNTSSVVGFTTSFDRSSNKFFERHLHAESRSHLYEPFANGTPQGGYDSLDRLRQYQRGVLSTNSGHNNLGGGGIDTPISLPNTDQSRTYDLDGLGNWRRTDYEPVGGSQTTEIRQHNALNQITRRDSTPFSYDLNGNLLDDGIRLYTWDALNRLANVRRKPDGSLIGEYTYDATGRRIQKIVTNGGLSGNIPNGTTHYLYTAWQCVEECDGFGSPLKQYVWGIYIDELLQQRLLTTINNHGAGDYFPLSDLLYRTTALTDSTTNIIETYDTDAYGNTLIFTAPGAANNWWADNAAQVENSTCDFIFTMRRFDLEVMLYFYRARIYGIQIGRFLSRDPRWQFSHPKTRRKYFSATEATVRASSEAHALGHDIEKYNVRDPSQYEYVGGSPGILVDPMGLQGMFCHRGAFGSVEFLCWNGGCEDEPWPYGFYRIEGSPCILFTWISCNDFDAARIRGERMTGTIA